jgi:hypothetical protein
MVRLGLCPLLALRANVPYPPRSPRIDGGFVAVGWVKSDSDADPPRSPGIDGGLARPESR